MSAQAFGRPVEILLVEDSPADVRLMEEALVQNGIPHHLSVVGDGMEASALLKQEGKYAGAPRPDIILLDLNLPRKNGREVLAQIKADEDLRRIPVVVLTVSKDKEDILQSYNNHANCYIIKPFGLDQFINAVKSIRHFWLTIATLPPRS